MTLPEAAQALLDALEGVDEFTDQSAAAEEAVRAALAAPPELGWEEGARAMEGLAAEIEDVAAFRRKLAHADAHAEHGRADSEEWAARRIREVLRALPVPSATTGAREAQRVSRAYRLPAPEATAESDVGWAVIRRKRRGGLIANCMGMDESAELYATREEAEAWVPGLTCPKDWDVLRIRLTVEPSPVEPEETQR